MRSEIIMHEKRIELVQAMLTPSELERFERLRLLTGSLVGGLELTPMRKCVFAREVLLQGLAVLEKSTLVKRKGVRG
jgi:hypothetical protein